MKYCEAKVLFKSTAGCGGCYNGQITVEELELVAIADSEAGAKAMIQMHFPSKPVEIIATTDTGPGNGGLLFPNSRVPIFSGLYADLPEELKKRLGDS